MTLDELGGDMAARRVGDAIVEVLQAGAVDTVFGIPGLHTLGLYDALAGAPAIRHILPRHEQGAAFAADGYARVTGRPGVCSTTTGPGTFNTLAAVAEAWSDSSPVVVLGGQIDSDFDGSGRGILHETPDQGRSFEALTSYVGRPRTAAAVPLAVAEALACSMTGRRGPAYVELPTDLLVAPFDGPVPVAAFPGPVSPDPDAVVAAARILAAGRRIAIVPGAGIQRADAAPGLLRLARLLDAPVLTPITGAGAIPADDPLWAGESQPRPSGMPRASRGRRRRAGGGVPARRRRDRAMDAAAQGARADRRRPDRYRALISGRGRRGRRCAPRHRWPARRTRRPPTSHRARLGSEPCQRHTRSDDERGCRKRAWRRGRLPSPLAPRRRRRHPHPRRRTPQFLDRVRLWPVYEGRTWVHLPWGSATLGFALGTANGAAVAAPGRRVVASCVDGGFLFTATELATAVAHQLDVTVLIHDDAAFGSIADYQIKRRGRAYATDLVNPDFVAFARSFGVPAERIGDVADLPQAMARAVSEPGPSVVVLAAPLGQPWD